MPIVSPLKGAPSLATPTNITAPAISGTPFAGQVLTCSTGRWMGNPAPSVFSYQWKKDGVSIGGQTASTYTVAASADNNKTITCAVSTTTSSGSLTVSSAGVVVQATPVNTVAPVISGTATVGSTLTSTTGTWTGTPTPTFSYQWKKGGVDILGSISSTHLVIGGESGSTLTCNVTATNTRGSASQVSNGIAIS